METVTTTTTTTRGTNHFIGFDLGTSGARISVIRHSDDDNTPPSSSSSNYNEIHSNSLTWSSPSTTNNNNNPYDSPTSWTNAIRTLLHQTPPDILQHTRSICISGTSASCLLIDKHSRDMTRPSSRMYDYDVVSSSSSNNNEHYGLRAMERLNRYAPSKHTARARTGSLAKLLGWNEERRIGKTERLCHQADFVAAYLTSAQRCGSGDDGLGSITSDWHNCLKLGYDVQSLQWPDWLLECLHQCQIPKEVLPSRVVSPGEPFGTIHPSMAREFGLKQNVVIVGGTTDSNAAFFAAVGGTQPRFGTAVTSLGSTLAMKQLSRRFCEDADRGVYSHRFPLFGVDDDDSRGESEEEAWLIGGASNVGCAALRQQGFTNEELEELSRRIDWNTESQYKYYPLTKIGERFPVADSRREPCLEPVPEHNRMEFLHGILQGISDVERDGFVALGDLGADPSRPSVVWTCGGGARNDMWIRMRERRLKRICGEEGVVVKRAENTEASFGAAILAAGSFQEEDG